MGDEQREDEVEGVDAVFAQAVSTDADGDAVQAEAGEGDARSSGEDVEA